MVLVGFVIACLFAGSPIFLSPLSVNATTDGVVLLPSLFIITVGSLPSITDTQLLVVPKSIPIIFPIVSLIFNYFQIVLLSYSPRPCQCRITDSLSYYREESNYAMPLPFAPHITF